MTITEKQPISEQMVNYTINPKTKKIMFDGDWYFPLKKVSKRRPKVTGAPNIIYQKFRTWVGRNKLTHKPMIGLVKTPNECSFYKLINYPFKIWGGPQVGIVGQYGYGKSTILSTIQANWLAQKHRFIQLDDAEFEAQKLAFHGYFTKDGNFHPFKIVIWVPEGYTFNVKAENHHPLHFGPDNILGRKNVTLEYFRNIEQIVDNMVPHMVNVIYKEAFDDASALRLLLDIIHYIKTKSTITKSYVIVTHEFGNLFPETPSGEDYDIIRKLAIKELRRLRKHNIGILTSFHAFYDVVYYISQKLGIILQVRPIIHKHMSQLEEEAKGYKRGDVAVYNGGYYRKHHIDELPTYKKEKFIYSPNEELWHYSKIEGPESYSQRLNRLLRIAQVENDYSKQEKESKKLEQQELKKKEREERLANREYIRERELEFKKELEAYKAELKAKAEAEALERKKEYELLKQQLYLEKENKKLEIINSKKLKNYELFQKAIQIIKDDNSITNTDLAKQLHVNYKQIKEIRNNIDKMLFEEKQQNRTNNE